MKNDFLILAKYNQEADKTIYAVLDGMSNEDREKDRGSYYGSLLGLFRHVIGGTFFFLGMFQAALPDKGAVQKALAPLEGLNLPKGGLAEVQWKDLGALLETVDQGLVDFSAALEDGDLEAPVKWFGGDPATVPLRFMLHNLSAHSAHHRGQISQILDELKIDNDYSGIKVRFLTEQQ
jgi:uncharacterized damage-inducible protein DinB